MGTTWTNKFVELDTIEETSSFKHILLGSRNGPGFYKPCGWKLQAQEGCTKFYSQSTYKDYPIISLEDTFRSYQYTHIDVSHVDTHNVVTMAKTFNHCKRLLHLDLSKWNTKSLKSTSLMLANCLDLITVDMHTWKGDQVEQCDGMFYNALSLEEINLEKFTGKKMVNATCWLESCKSLGVLDIRNLSLQSLASHSTYQILDEVLDNNLLVIASDVKILKYVEDVGEEYIIIKQPYTSKLNLEKLKLKQQLIGKKPLFIYLTDN